MSRGGQRNNMRRQSDAEFARIHGEIRSTISTLAQVYDSGSPNVAPALATEISKFLTTGDKITSVRKDTMFTTVDFDYSPLNLAAEHKLIVADFHGHSDQEPPFFVTFRHASSGPTPNGFKSLSFVEWWNRDIIYRASAAPDQSRPLLIPTNPAHLVPRNSRKTLTRREFIQLVRNKLGAHLDRHLPEELDNLLRSSGFGIAIEAEVAGTKLSTEDGSLPVTIGPWAAMVRQIAHEVLEAFPGDHSGRTG